MPAIDALQNLQNSLIRKSLNGSVFIADTSVASVDEATLFDATSGDLTTLPTGFEDLGYLTDAGAKFARSISESNVTSWQSVTPSRSDTTADTTTLAVSAQETKLLTIGLYTGTDTASIKTTATANGVVRIDKPATPSARFWRVLSVSVDETNDGEIVIARYLPNAKVIGVDEQDFAKGDNPVLWGVTFTGFVDDTIGTAESYLFGGAGWLSLLASMGFTAGP